MIQRAACSVLTVLCLGCLDPDVFYEVSISGSVTSEESGPVELWFLHNTWGEDTLQTQYMVIDTLWLESPTTFATDLSVPQGNGEGLSIYGWQDHTEDGQHCRPGTDPELSGLAHVSEYPAHVIEVSLSLETPCEGPEGL